jgi:signal transduction histidine kinase
MTTDQSPVSRPAPLALVNRIVSPLPDIVLAIVFLVLWIVAEVGRAGSNSFDSAMTPLVYIVWVVPFAAISVAIACARKAPLIAHGVLIALFVTAGLAPVFMLTATSWPAYLGVAFAVGLAAGSRHRRWGWPSLALGLLYAAAIAWLMVWRYAGTGNTIVAWAGLAEPLFEPVMRKINENTSVPVQVVYAADMLNWTGAVIFAFAAAVIVFCWAVGFGIRAALDRFRSTVGESVARQELDAASTRLAVAEERGRIARDLHDVLAHSLTVVVVQADGLRRTTDRSPAKIDAALGTIADAARSAIGDIRLVVESLRGGDADPSEPTLVDITGLLRQMGEQGLRIERSDFGDPQRLGAGAQLSVYRIVQESLTNALAHGGIDSVVRLGFDWRGTGLALTIVSRSGDEATARSAPGGNGIPGMRERASIVGGWLTAGPDEDGEFRVSAYIPFDDVSRETSEDERS